MAAARAARRFKSDSSKRSRELNLRCIDSLGATRRPREADPSRNGSDDDAAPGSAGRVPTGWSDAMRAARISFQTAARAGMLNVMRAVGRNRTARVVADRLMVCRRSGTVHCGTIRLTCRAAPLRCAGRRSRRSDACLSAVTSRRTCMRHKAVSGCTHRRADATPAARFNRFSSTRRIRPRAARSAPPRSASPRSPSVRMRRDGRPTRLAQLEETT